jgi:hypothetical protein
LANLEFSVVGSSTVHVGLAHTGNTKTHMGNTFVAVYLFIYFFVLCGNQNTSSEKKEKKPALSLLLGASSCCWV